MIRSVQRRLSQAGGERDAGMTIIELLVSLVIFAIVATGVLVGLVSAMTTSRGDRARVAASGLAARELEIVRNEFNATASAPITIGSVSPVVNPHPLPSGTVGSPLVLDNNKYTVTRTVEWQFVGTGQSACDGGSAVSYPTLAVRVTVTWPSMNGAKPIESNTLLTPTKSVLTSALGFAAIKVLDAYGQPYSGRQVTLTGPGGTYSDDTSADGCATFAISTPGSYTASLTSSGYVDIYGNASASGAVAVAGGSIVQKTFHYDKAMQLNVTQQTQVGWALPTTIPPITLANPQLQPLGVKVVPAASAVTTVTGLWPLVDSVTDLYSVWSSSCNNGNPGAIGGTATTAPQVAPGGTSSVTVTLAPLTVTVTKGGLPLTNAVVTATPVATAGCVSPDLPSLTLGTTGAGGLLKTSVPGGSWQLKVNGYVATWPSTPVLLPNAAPTAMIVAIP